MTARLDPPDTVSAGFAERFFAISRDLLCVTDACGVAVLVNAAMQRVLGHDASEFRRWPLRALLHPDDAGRVLPLLDRCRAERREVEFRARMRRADGSYAWMAWHLSAADDDGVVFATGRDVTAEQAAEAAVVASEARLRVSEERFRSLSSSSPVGMYETDLAGTITYANPRAHAIYEVSDSEDQTQAWTDRIHPDDRDETVRRLRDPVEMSTEHQGTYRLLLPDGTVKRLQARSAPRRDAAGSLVGAVGIIEDVTSRWMDEQQMRQAQKMEAVGQLAGGIAHDFNNLLTVIRTYTDFILEQLEPSSPLHADADEVRKAAGRAASLTSQLLAFSRKQVLQPRVLDLNEIVRGMEPMLRRLIGEDIRVELQLAGALGAIRADPGQLDQVVMNLVVNARDAMPQGGVVTITTRTEELGEDAGHGVIPGTYAALLVRDTGCGMDPATRRRVFEPFFTTKEVGRGTGLGLSMAYGIVKQSNGYIWCDTAPGAGSTFRVLLPVVDEGLSPRRAPVSAGRGGASGVVLLAEDEDAIRALTRRILEREGYTVLEARDGRDALRVAAAYPLAIDLLVSDMVMPNLGGNELHAQLRVARPELRALFISGYTDDDITRRGLSEGGNAFLQKPFTAQALAAAAAAALAA